MSPALCLPARIEGEWAARYFSRPRLRNLFGLWAGLVRVAQAGDSTTRIPPFVERLWMPAYAIRLRTLTGQKENHVWAAIDAWLGQFSLFECVEDLVLTDLNDDSFPPHISENQATALARGGLQKHILRQRGQFHKPEIDVVEELKLYYHPVWVYYYRRRSKYLDIKVLDGYSGKSGGAKMRVAVVNALVAAHQRTQQQE
ncbi:MAG: hypothetical protein HY706_05335 [Candidatus Hydrogenedentes bacterium]|nr:hypothetical protein [Candidatus Hydrogenedentota bacterium]